MVRITLGHHRWGLHGTVGGFSNWDVHGIFPQQRWLEHMKKVWSEFWGKGPSWSGVQSHPYSRHHREVLLVSDQLFESDPKLILQEKDHQGHSKAIRSRNINPCCSGQTLWGRKEAAKDYLGLHACMREQGRQVGLVRWTCATCWSGLCWAWFGGPYIDQKGLNWALDIGPSQK